MIKDWDDIGHKIYFATENNAADRCVYGKVEDPLEPDIITNQHICDPDRRNVYSLELRVSLEGSINSQQDTTIANNQELRFDVWPYNICMDTTLNPFNPMTFNETNKMYNFVFVETWREY